MHNVVGLQKHHQDRSGKSRDVTAGARTVLQRIPYQMLQQIWRYDPNSLCIGLSYLMTSMTWYSNMMMMVVVVIIIIIIIIIIITLTARHYSLLRRALY